MERREPPADPPWEALEALAAGELPAAYARRLRERLGTEPGWQDAWSRVRSVEDLLRGEPMLALPLSLVQDTLRRLDLTSVLPPLERETPWRVLARVAAAVLVFCTAWFAWSGTAPAMADAGPRPELVASLAPVLPEVPAVIASGADTGGSLGLAALGAFLLVAGVWLSLRWHGRATATGGAA